MKLLLMILGSEMIWEGIEDMTVSNGSGKATVLIQWYSWPIETIWFSFLNVDKFNFSKVIKK